ncbi:hypothetical protein [Microbacterium sp.]|uniref:hypothetical protein n=1 Tax=Microbacterium sp. TaxID=51671 RepID=UPI003A8F4EFE
MLVIRRAVDRTLRADDGAALVAVVMVMLVGVIVTATIAASVLFTISTNVTNKSSTQAFVAAESGRDALLAKVVGSACGPDPANPSWSGPGLSNSSVANGPLFRAVATTGPDEATQSPACPSATGASVIVITSTGSAPDGTETTIKATYNRPVTYKNQPGGSMSYFDGTFTLTQSQYNGDLVIRSGDYNCTTSHSTISGDLWVPNGSVNLSSNCSVTGSIYAKGSVTFGASTVAVGGRIIAGGPIRISTNGFTVGGRTPAQPGDGDILSGAAIDLTGAKSGSITGNVRAAGAYSAGDSVTITGVAQGGVSPTPAVFDPTLKAVYDMTKWVDVGSDRTPWGSDVDWYSVPAGQCSVDMTSRLMSTPAPGKTRLGIDYSSCTTDVTIKINTTLILPRDAVFLVPPTRSMALDLSGSPKSPAGSTTQLFFVHADDDVNSTPDCDSGVAQDDFGVPVSIGVNLMFYTPCGVGKITGKQKNPFVGQFYAGNSGTSGWVQPTFNCQPMKWIPLIDMGCKIGQSGGSGPGTTTYTLMAPSILTQTEIPTAVPTP